MLRKTCDHLLDRGNGEKQNYFADKWEYLLTFT